MFLHAGWLHIIGNMVFFWAFGPEIEDAMGRFRFLAFYLIGGVVAMTRAGAGGADVAGAEPGRERGDCGGDGRVPRDVSARPHQDGDLVSVLHPDHVYSGGAADRGVVPDAVVQRGAGGAAVQTGGVAYLAHIGGFLFGVVTGRLWSRKGALGSQWQRLRLKMKTCPAGRAHCAWGGRSHAFLGFAWCSRWSQVGCR